MYNTSIVSYIDILGFSNMVCNSSFEDINMAVGIFQKEFTPPENEKEIIGRNFSFFSDSFFATVPAKRHQFFAEIYIIAITQVKLLFEESILIRGAVSIGDVYHSKNKIFGPPIVRAVNLEKGITYPIVQIDDYALKYYKKNSSLWSHPKCEYYTFSKDFKNLKPLIGRTEVGKYFIDYLGYIFTGDAGGNEFVAEFLEKHKQLIVSGLKTRDCKIKEKFQWLRTYHNRKLKENNVNKRYNLYIG